jgi:hypothetical protein
MKLIEDKYTEALNILLDEVVEDGFEENQETIEALIHARTVLQVINGMGGLDALSFATKEDKKNDDVFLVNYEKLDNDDIKSLSGINTITSNGGK